MRKHRILAILMIFLLLAGVNVWAKENSTKAEQEKSGETTVAEDKNEEAAKGDGEDEAEESLPENIVVVDKVFRVAEFKDARIRFNIPESLGTPQRVNMSGSETMSYQMEGDRAIDIETSPDITAATIHNLRDLSEAEIQKYFEQAEEGYQNLQFAVSQGDIVYFNDHPFFRFEGVYQAASLISYQTVVNGYYVTMRVQDFKANGQAIREPVKELNEQILASMEVTEALPAENVNPPGAGSSWIVFAVLLGIIALIGISYYLSERKVKQAKEANKAKENKTTK